MTKESCLTATVHDFAAPLSTLHSGIRFERFRVFRMNFDQSGEKSKAQPLRYSLTVVNSSTCYKGYRRFTAVSIFFRPSFVVALITNKNKGF